MLGHTSRELRNVLCSLKRDQHDMSAENVYLNTRLIFGGVGEEEGGGGGGEERILQMDLVLIMMKL